MPTSHLTLNKILEVIVFFFVSFPSLFLFKQICVGSSRQYLAVLGEENILRVIFQNLNLSLNSTRKTFFFLGVYLEELILKFPSLAWGATLEFNTAFDLDGSQCFLKSLKQLTLVVLK